MGLPAFDLHGLSGSTPYADVHRAERGDDGAAVRAELLRTSDPLAAEADAARAEHEQELRAGPAPGGPTPTPTS